MTFARVNPLGWALYEELASAQMNQLDINMSRAIDGFAGGAYAPSGVINIGGAGMIINIIGGNPTFTGNVQIDGTLDVDDDATFNDPVEFNDHVDFIATATFSGVTVFDTTAPVQFQNIVEFDAQVDFDANVDFNSTVDFFGDISIGSSVTITCTAGSTLTGNFNFTANTSFASNTITVAPTCTWTFNNTPKFSTGLEVDNDEELTWYDDGVGSSNREKWKGIPLTPLFNDWSIGWVRTNLAPAGNKYWLNNEDTAGYIVFEADLNMGISRVVEVVARVSGASHVGGDPTTSAMVLGVSIADHQGSIVWSGTVTDTATGAGMDTPRDLSVTVNQPITSSGASVYHLIISVLSPQSTGTGITHLKSIRVLYRYSHLDA